MNFQDKTVLITGSSRGIGAATARLAHNYGARVILHGRTESENLRNLATELGTKYITCDVVDESTVNREVREIEGGIDVLINSAGINLSQPFLEQSTESWQNTFNVNVLGTVNFCKAVLPGMIGRKYGRIVNISSVKGYSSNAGSPAYSASKAAVINMTAAMAKEYASHGILVNAVAPGFTMTEMTKQTWSDRIQKQVDEILLKRMAKPEEIANAILFLASDNASYITGQTLLVDGGYNLKV